MLEIALLILAGGSNLVEHGLFKKFDGKDERLSNLLGDV